MGSSRNSLTIILIIFLSSLMLVLEKCHAQDSRQDFLDAHNRARAEVGVAPLFWDEEVARFARDYAKRRQGDCTPKHSHGPYGENIAWATGDLSGVKAVKLWVDEKSIYDYKSNECIGGIQEVCRHYTQVVWEKSTRLGCAKVRCYDGNTFITCNYDPPGNIEGEWPYNVLAMKV